MASKSYIIDLGVNTTLQQEVGTSFPLQDGLVLQATTGTNGRGDAAWYTQFLVRDFLSFRIWDISPKAARGQLRISNFEAKFFVPGSGNRVANPFDDDVALPLSFSKDIFPANLKEVSSSVYPESSSGWVLGEPSLPAGKRFQFGNTGRFMLQVVVEVVVEKFERTYRLDPEIIVGPAGGPDSVIGQDRISAFVSAVRA